MKNTLLTTITIIITLIAAANLMPAIANESGMIKPAGKAKTAKPKVSTEDARKTAAKQEVNKLTTTQQSKLLTMLNEGSEKDLVAIKGIALSKSKSIVAARPYQAIEEVAVVKGIGKATFNNVVEYGKSLTEKKATMSTES